MPRSQAPAWEPILGGSASRQERGGRAAHLEYIPSLQTF
ncbi:hypothetical protein GXM_06274 [Nostoc sphaeroides CCNUC1]|uniref:Uncharacterized protein n=1 Tax=Nostoc sphaeroides CCNUC1 TaxID=2653204 RepID=A0A5P8W7Z8_9NOSO|nr:hypothetical protein GXM_06274 [Nostoc sphaeroides CCNUC1]